MRLAVIENGFVTNIIEAEPDFQWPGRQLVPAQAAGIGWHFNDGVLQPPPPEPRWSPQQVTDLQFRLALNQAGRRGDLERVIAQASPDLRDWWDRQIAIDRDDPAVATLGRLLAMRDEDLDALFLAASTF